MSERVAAVPMLQPSLNLARAWWDGLDRTLLGLFGALIMIGIVLCAAAGPPTAMRIGIANPMHFFERQLLFLVPALGLMLGASILSANNVRRVGVVVGAGALCLMALAAIAGPEVKGAQRWLSVAGFSLQPSEFFKPGFVMIVAWFLAEGARDKSFPGAFLSLGVFGLGGLVLLVQPDYGQLMLLTAIWGMMFFIAGMNWSWMMALGGGAVGVILFGYQFAPHVRSRIDRFLDPSSGDTYQVDMAMQAISGGGLAGHSLHDTPGVKGSLPDAHSDFIFAVAGEEFGFILCLAIIALFGAIALRSLWHAYRIEGVFRRVAIVGLAVQMAFQAMVNIGVNLSVLPAKGMTLPFVSYGGSSLMATGLTAGLLLALTRQPRGRHAT